MDAQATVPVLHPQHRSEESLKHEYSELMQSFRHYSAVRYAVLTLFFTVTGALAAVVTTASEVNPMVVSAAPYFGLVICSTLGLMAYHVERLLLYYVEVGEDLERTLGGYRLILGRPMKPSWRPHHIVAVNVIMVIIGWALLLVARYW